MTPLQRLAGNRATTIGLRLQRQILDPEYEEDVFDAAEGKRQTELANLQLGSSGIAADDPRKQTLEGFFSQPENIRGTRSYPAPAPVGDRSRRTPPTGGTPDSTLPDVLVLGDSPTSGEARVPEAAEAEHDLASAHQTAVQKDPGSAAAIGALRDRAAASITALAKSHVGKTAWGVATPEDPKTLAGKLAGVIDGFTAEARRIIEQATWERKVAAQIAFVEAREHDDAARLAIRRAGDDLTLAARYYSELYAQVGFDPEKLAAMRAANLEETALLMASRFSPLHWPPFLGTLVDDPELVPFAMPRVDDLVTTADPATVLRMWRANPVAVTSAAVAEQILGLAVVGGDAPKGIAAAKMLGWTALPDLHVLTALSDQGHLTMAQIVSSAKLGGDIASNQEMIVAGVSRKDCAAFNDKAGDTRIEVASRWARLVAAVGGNQRRAQLVATVARADGATPGAIDTLIDDHHLLEDHNRISARTVARLLRAGMLRARGHVYTSGRYGLGSTWVFELAGGGRLDPEWHIHYKAAGKRTTVVGAGWKKKSQKFGVGVKRDDRATAVVAALKELGVWKEPRI